MKLHKSVRLFTDKHLENIGSVFQRLYEDEVLTDCTIYCKDGSIKAHKLILAASSRYFRQVFIDHNAIFMYGITFSQLKYLVELIYKGSIDVSCDNFSSIFDLAEDLQIADVLVEDGSLDNKPNGFGRDTRYKGQKRVATDFVAEQSPSASKCSKNIERRSSSGSDKSANTLLKNEYDNDTDNEVQTIDDQPSETIDIDSISDGDRFIGHNIDNQIPLSPWARKERKFQCDLCPSSFKRASHLSRHQLVHTGERPFPCDQCDKAFSRHDKLKHHVHKAHELGALNEALGPDSLYTIDRIDILTPETRVIESHENIVTHQNISQAVSHSNMIDYRDIPSASGIDIISPPQKKGRGRPRKYPPVPAPLVKRPRGRPRIKPVVPPSLVKRPRGRPRRSVPISIDIKDDNDGASIITNDSDNDDIEIINKTDDRCSGILPSQEIMEPFVEIKTDPNEKTIPPTEGENTNFFENIGLFENTAIAKIGECTISVSTVAPNDLGGNK